MTSYAKKIHTLLSPDMRRLFSRLNSPQKIQDYLDTLKINFETEGETNLSPARMVSEKKAHCFEGAVFAAAVLAYHGKRPLLMDFATAYDDEDHAIALFRENGRWGAISKTNHAILLYRDAVYASPRELAMSYFHEYYMWDGRKSLRGYSAPFDLSRFAPEKWITTEESLDWIHERIARSRYYDIAPAKSMRKLRKAAVIELKAMRLTQWKRPKKR